MDRDIDGSNLTLIDMDGESWMGWGTMAYRPARLTEDVVHKGGLALQLALAK